MESEVSLPCSQELAPRPYPDPHELNPHLPTLFPYDPF